MGANRKRTYLPIGHKSGYLELVGYAADVKINGATVRRAIVKCVCGVFKEINYSNLFGEKAVQSCGCKSNAVTERKRLARLEIKKRLEEDFEKIRIRKSVEAKKRIDEFRRKMAEGERDLDVNKLINETRKFLNEDVGRAYFYYEENMPITVGDFVIDDNVSKFEGNE